MAKLREEKAKEKLSRESQFKNEMFILIGLTHQQTFTITFILKERKKERKKESKKERNEKEEKRRKEKK